MLLESRSFFAEKCSKISVKIMSRTVKSITDKEISDYILRSRISCGVVTFGLQNIMWVQLFNMEMSMRFRNTFKTKAKKKQFINHLTKNNCGYLSSNAIPRGY